MSASRRAAGRLAAVAVVAVVVVVGVEAVGLVGPSGGAARPTGPGATSASPARAGSLLWSAAPAAADELPSPERSPEEVRRTADDVLSAQEFQRPPKPWFQRVQEAVFDALGRVLNALFSGGAGNVVAWVLVALIVAGLVFFGLRIGRTVRRDPGTALEVTVTPRATAAEWRGRAEDFEAAGDWKQALRCRYRALVADLAERDVLRDVPGRTAGEYRRDVEVAVPSAEDDFAGASALFEAAWYGDEPTGPEENERFRSLSDRVLSQAGRS
ncbi:MAG: DUF4129 domain-containing protein [Acidimicrobiales bacterium]